MGKIAKTRLEKYLEEVDYSEGNTSNIWNSLRKDFQSGETTLRGYGLASISKKRMALFHKLSRLLTLPWRALRVVSTITIKAVNRCLSWLVLGDKLAAEKYGFSYYNLTIYDKNDLVDFENRYQNYKIGFSHNTFKSFSYLKRLEENVKLERN